MRPGPVPGPIGAPGPASPSTSSCTFSSQTNSDRPQAPNMLSKSKFGFRVRVRGFGLCPGPGPRPGPRALGPGSWAFGACSCPGPGPGSDAPFFRCVAVSLTVAIQDASASPMGRCTSARRAHSGLARHDALSHAPRALARPGRLFQWLPGVAVGRRPGHRSYRVASLAVLGAAGSRGGLTAFGGAAPKCCLWLPS